MNRTSFVVCTLSLVLLGAIGRAQAPGPPGRGGQGPFPGRFGGPPPDEAAQPKGAARITGRVVSVDTGSPVRRAQVSLSSAEARMNRVVTTDNDGRYELADLPAGRYQLRVSKAGYVTLEYGQARPFEAGKPIDLVNGQVLERIDFGLPRGSVITGRITDEFGDPLPDAQVQAMRYEFVNGERRLVNAGRIATTDDIGQFRIFGLMPGDYIVRASVRMNRPFAAAVAAAEDRSGYPPTYFPGTAELGQAQTITVGLAQELGAISFSLAPARFARVSGTVMSSNGNPLSGAMVIVRALAGGGRDALNVGGGTQVRPDGTFVVSNLPPGEYMLDVQQRPRNLPNFQAADLSQLEFASVPLTVSGSDISGLTIQTTTGVSVAGRVQFEGQAGQKPTARGMRIAGSRSGPAIMAFVSRALGGGRVNADGTFEIRGLDGPQLIRAMGVPSGWMLKSVMLDGMDITDAPYDFKPGQSFSSLVITLTNRISELTGAVRDARGQPAADYVVVVFPEDARLWHAQSRFIATARPNQNGTFSLKSLPAGRYVAAAVRSLENGRQYDPAMLERLRPGAQAFSLVEGQNLNLNLQMPGQ